MFKHEGEMYPHLRKFLIERGCNEEKTGYTNEKGASDGKTLSLALFGRNIEPDVYGVDDTKGIIYLAEGKITHGGRSLDEAIVQGVTYQRFAHYVYVFFPKAIDDEDILRHVKEQCKEHGLGLLLIDNQQHVEEIVAPKLSKFYGDQSIWAIIRDNIGKTKEEINTLLLFGGGGRVGNVHLPILRDVCYLLGGKKGWNEGDFINFLMDEYNLLDKYRDRGEEGDSSSLAPYDWKIKNPLLKKRSPSRETITDDEIREKFREFIEETLKSLEYLDLCRIKEESISLTSQGINFRNAIKESTPSYLHKKEVGDTVRRAFISILLAKKEVEKEILKMCEIIKEVQPQPRFKFWCDKCDHEKDWSLNKSEKKEFLDTYKKYNKIYCPRCNNEKVPQPYNLLMAANGLDETYRLEIFLEETKIIQKTRSFDKLPPEMRRKFRESIDKPRKTAYWYLGENAPYLFV